MRLIVLLRALLAACLFLPVAGAQTPSDQPDSDHQSTPQHHQLSAIGIEIRPAKHRPFSARDTIEITRNRSEGVQTDRNDDPHLARDSEGRIYREIREGKPAAPNSHAELLYIVLLDPVAHTRTDCEMATRTCTVSAYATTATDKPPEHGSLDNDRTGSPHESIGTEMMEGLEVEGIREIIPTPASANDRPQLTDLEFWYSADLEINLSVKRTYSNGNTQSIRVVDVSRDEPDAGLFRIPAGFVVQDQRTTAKVEN